MGTEVCGPSFTVRRSGFGVWSSEFGVRSAFSSNWWWKRLRGKELEVLEPFDDL